MYKILTVFHQFLPCIHGGHEQKVNQLLDECGLVLLIFAFALFILCFILFLFILDLFLLLLFFILLAVLPQIQHWDQVEAIVTEHRAE